MSNTNDWLSRLFINEAKPALNRHAGSSSADDGLTIAEQVVDGSIAEIVFPDVTAIRSYMFYNCDSLTNVILPECLTEISREAFGSCGMLSCVTFEGKPTIDSDVFKSCSKLTTINVPWAEGEVANAPWGATKATINYNYTETPAE